MKNKYMCSMKFVRVLLVILATISVVSMNGKDISKVRPIKNVGTDTVKVNQVFRITADTCSETHINNSIRNLVRLRFESGMLGNNGDTSVSVRFSIKDENNKITSKTLNINTLQKASSETYIREALFQFSGSLDYEITIDSIKVNGQSVMSFPSYISLIGEINVDRTTAFQYNTSTTPEYKFLTGCVQGTTESIQINWENITGAEEYQLEWTFVNDYSGTFDNQHNPQYLSASDVFYDFKNNSTRITTTSSTHTITNIFEHGYLLFRVRGIGRDFNNQEIFGVWSIPVAQASVSTLSNTNNVNYYHNTTVHEGNKNWQYAATYAEEGKKKEVISYFDGSLRNRQSVTKTNTDNTVLVGQTIYDSQGRPAVNVLPVPVAACNGTNAVKYYNNFNRNGSNEPYNYLDFENETNSCASYASPMNTSSGASNYYSSANTLKDRQQAYLPDASGYPFTQIRYTPDNTGRVTLQSGVGPEFKIGSGQEIANFYGQPDQIQLDRMFGSEAGDASHYKKNLVIDANKQASVSYLNQEGKVVATSLAGASPSGMSAIKGITQTKTLDVDMFKEDANGVSQVNKVSDNGKSIEFSTQVLVASNASIYTFNYGLNVTDYKDNCMDASNICFSCVYDLQIMVMDECENIVKDTNGSDTYTQKKFIGSFQTNANGEVVLNSNCTTNPNHEYSYTPSPIKVNLDRGVYTVIKVLTLNEDALNYYVEQYLDTNLNSCMKKLSEFQGEAFAEMSLSDCDLTCDKCKTELGSRETWVAEGKGTVQEWDRLFEECGAPCREINLCEGYNIMLLKDVSLYGQYGNYEVGSDGNPILDLFSVMNDNNQFGPAKNWRNPKITLNGNEYNIYVDANGSPAKVELHQNGSGTWLPAPKSGVVLTADEDGRMFINPQDLANVSDFVSAWQSSWAKSLIIYHPEYCQYEQCIKNIESFSPTYNITSDGFDQLLMRTTTFKQAVAAQLIYAVGSDHHITEFFNSGTGRPYDPYAVPNSLYTSQSSILANKFLYYLNNHSIEGVASYLTRYGTHYGTDSLASYGNFGIDYVPTQDINPKSDNEWNMAKNLYLSEKRKVQEQEANLACEDGLDNAWITSHGKIPRFYGQENIPAAVANSEDDVTSEVFYQTGLCPMAFDMMNFLSAMANARKLEESINLDFCPEFTERLYNTIPRYHTIDNRFYNVKWEIQSKSSAEIGVFFRSEGYNTTDPENPDNYKELTISKSSTKDWSEIVGIQGLTDITYNNGFYTFTAQARVFDPNNQIDPYSYFPITGSTDIDIMNCSIPAQSTANGLSADLRNLWIALAGNNQFESTSEINLTAGYSTYLTHNITSLIGGTGDFKWKKSTISNEYEISRTTGSAKIIVMHINTPTSVNLTDVTTFGPLSVNNQEGFEIDALLLDHTISSHLSGFIYIKNGDNSTNNVSVGHYGLYIPGSCTGTAYQLTNDLSELLKGLIITQSDFNDVVASKNLTESNFYTTLLETTLGPSGCKLILTTHLNGTFDQIKITGNAIPYGVTNSDGTYSNFYMLADYYVTIDNVQHIIHDTIFIGSSCLHINRCLCPLQTEAYADQNWFMSKVTGTYNNTQEILNAIIAGTIVHTTNIAAIETVNFSDNFFNSNTALPGATWFKHPLGIATGYIIYEKKINLTTPLAELDLQILPLIEAYVLINGQVVNHIISPAVTSPIPFTALQVSGMSDYLHLGENTLQILVKLSDKLLPGDIGIRGYIRTAVPCNTDFNPNNLPHFYTPIGNPCQDQLTATALNNAQSAYQQYLSDLTTEITEKYRSHCMGSLNESFTGTYPDQEYHFTLYYYDQAGNLIKTIPPEGVELLQITSNTSPLEIKINLDRTNKTHSVFTNHRMETRYEYNSLNQLVKQVTPDHDKLDIWEKKLPNGLPTGLTITATQFVNANKGYLTGSIGTRGAMYETNNGGATWNKMNDLVASDLKKVFKVPSSTRLFAVGSGGVVLKSTNGGDDWDMLDTYNTPIAEDLTDLHFTDENHGIVVGTNGKSYYTNDGGATFATLTNLPTTTTINAIAYHNSNYFIATSDNGVGKIYTKSGNSWVLQTNSTQSKSLANIQYNNEKWHAVGELGNILSSTDGIVWQVVESQTTQKIADIHYFSENVCIALIEDQNHKKRMMQSADGGKVWSPLGNVSTRYNSLYMNKATSGFIAGTQGVINQIEYSASTHTVGIMPLNEPEVNMTADVSGIHASSDGNKIWVATINYIYYGTRDIEHNIYNFTWIRVSKSTTSGYKKCYANYTNNTALLLQNNGTIIKANVAGSVILITDNFATGIADITVTTSNVVAVNNSGTVKFTAQNPISTFANVTTYPGTISNITSLASNGNNLSMTSSDGKLYNATFNATTMTWNDYSSNISPLPINDLYSNVANMYAVGDCGSMYKYVSNQWQPVSTATTAKLTSVKTNSTQTVITGTNGTLSVIENTTITPIATATNNTLNEVSLNATFDKGYAIGANGTVFYMVKTNNVWSAQPATGSGTLNLDYSGLTIIGDEAIVIGGRSSICRQAELVGLKNRRVYTPELKSLSFANTLNGYVVGSEGTIRHTTDGGITWSIVLPSMSPLKVMNTVCATSADHALIGGNSGYAASITANTTPQTITGLNASNIYTIKSRGTNVYMGGANGKLYKSINSGTAWTIINTGTITSDIRAIHIFSNNGCIVAGTQGLVANYDNTTFTLTAKHNGIPTGAQLNDIYFHDDRNGYVVGNNGAIYKSKANGDAFETGTTIDWIAKTLVDEHGIDQTAAANVNINTIAFPSRYNGFIAGNISNSSTYARMLHDESEMYSTYFWYDRLGRMVVSQNAKQFNPNAFSYTLYDDLGRIKEVGEIRQSSLTKFNSIFGAEIGNLYNPNVINDDHFYEWIVANTRSQITRTFYDKPVIAVAGIVQNNLRKRVSCATYSDLFNADSTQYDYATHYTYDIHGNVNTLWQDNKKLTGDLASQRFKRIDYDYDLVSGKVNDVKYQANQPDQFIHRYEYDADNRITDVYTSKDGIQFDCDAKYYYYLHGPLARVEVGNELVQGVDYAYTLQGWIKGVNSNSLNETRDMGTDGKASSTNSNIARDAFGYSLSYYDDYFATVNGQQVYHFGDYTPIHPDKQPIANNFIASTNNMTNLAVDAPNLYNGNIKSMVTTITNPTSGAVLPQITAYRYDQLNRIIGMKAFADINVQDNEWNSNTYAGRYQSDFSYDANGNIESLQRKNKDGNLFDDFTYKYQKSGGKTVNNRLFHVKDSQDAWLMSDDIDDQGVYDTTTATINSVNNYGYDEIGNLQRDSAEGIKHIEWTAYGKIKSITRRDDFSKTVNGQTVYPSNLEFRYDPTGNRIAKIEKPRDATGQKTWEYWLTTYYVRDATGNPMGTYKQSAPSEASSYKLIERPIYGSSRVGIDNTQLELIGYTPPTSGILTNVLGLKQYEFTNHLGNVLTTVSDKKIPVDVGNDGTIDYYVADITSASDYYPFGSPLDGRTFSSDKYRFGFNGQEKDDEVAGAGNYLNFKYRLEDSRLCRFFAIDPLSDKYPELTPYQVASLNPIWMREIEGLEGKKPPYNNGDSDKKTPLNTLALPSLPNSNPTKNKNIPGLNTPPQSQEPIKQDNTAPAAIGIVSNQIVNSTATHQEATSGAVLGVTDALDPIAKIAEVNGAKWAPNFSKGVTGVQVGFIFKDFLDGKYQEAATGVADLASGTVGLMFKISYAASQTEYGLEGTGDVLADDRLFNLHQWKVTGDEAYLNKAIVSEKALITVQQKLMLK